ncbi:histidine phosphatase family protein [Candidatus Saccharibacteria bacterium]|nr:histidine phosphatase family protein [Candidatus Saccharibacteria bacterium]HPR09147.1 histidine phosphatase family protein [Candidatus Saccharibacteria bacterium]
MTRYYFTRHGESQANVDQIFAGSSMDSPLTEVGRMAAQEEGKRLKEVGLSFDLIVWSPLSRALETAKIIAQMTQYPQDKIGVEELLLERSFGTLAGKPWSIVEDESATMISAMGGESIDDIARRVRLALVRITQIAVGKHSILIVGHGSWYQMAESLLLGKDPSSFLEANSLPNNVVVPFPLS